jgi:CxxC motif-containing protein (DUF1111 family)
MKISTVILVAFMLGGVISCSEFFPATPANDQLLDGPVDGLSADEHIQFMAGDAAFNDQIFTPATGLGPLFVATSCGSCHAGDGKGHPFTTLTRFGQSDETGNKYLHLGGPQLQHKAIPGFQPEVIPAGAPSTKILPPANTGLGYLEIVPDQILLMFADPNDLDQDGISGVPNWVSIPDYVIPRADAVSQNGKYIGRFGKKAAVYSLLQQTVSAYNQDMGVTSDFERHDTYSNKVVDPEVSSQTVNAVVFYLQTLKAPSAREIESSEIIGGKKIFNTIGCGKCHIPQLKTGNSSVKSLANTTVYPYTDLLLHDMGAGLDDGYTEGAAKTSEWRTPALWGLGLSKQSQGGQYYLMHDGRAGSIEQSILLHGGESQNSTSKYQSLSESEKRDLISFLESL